MRNVVKLQIEKDAIATLGHRTNHGRTFGSEELLADLDATDSAANGIGERQGFGGRRDVERHEHGIHACTSCCGVVSIAPTRSLTRATWCCRR